MTCIDKNYIRYIIIKVSLLNDFNKIIINKFFLGCIALQSKKLCQKGSKYKSVQIIIDYYF